MKFIYLAFVTHTPFVLQITMKIPTPIFSFFCVSFMSVSIWAQQDTLSTKSYDELEELITTYVSKDSTLAFKITRYYLEKASTEKNKEKMASAKGRLGFLLGQAAYLESGIAYLDEAILLYKQLDLRELEMRAHLTKGRIYNSNGLFPESIASYYKGLDIAKETADYSTYYSVINRIGWIKGSLEDYVGAIEIMQQGLRQLSDTTMVFNENIGTQHQLKVALTANIAKAFDNANMSDSSLVYVNRAFELAKPKADSCYQKTLYMLRAEAQISKNKYNLAKEDIEKYKSICGPLSKTDSLIIGGNMGKIFYGIKQYAKAIEELNRGLKAYNVPEDEEKYMEDYYKTLAKAHKKEGNIDSANYYLEKHINTTMEFDKLSKDLSTSFKNREIEEFQQELDDLTKQRSQRDSLILYGSIVGGAIIFLLILGLVRTNKERKANEIKFQNLLDKVNASLDLEPQIINTKDTELDQKTSVDVNPETTQQILDGLKKLEEQHYYLHPACSAHNVAKRIKTNTTYLSKVINTTYQKNFSTYVNDLRINYAVLKLKEDKKFRGYTVNAIATELGYKSADSFTKYFRQHTGLLPSFYIKKLNTLT